VWREERTVTLNLTLHYDRMLLLDPTPFARGLVRKKVDVVNYPDGRFAIQFEGMPLSLAEWQHGLSFISENREDGCGCLPYPPRPRKLARITPRTWRRFDRGRLP
jgi:hypothetical protein